MKNISTLLLFILLASDSTSTSCKKAHCNLKNAVITCHDFRKCTCCGGYLINFNEEPQSYQGKDYMVQHDLKQFGIDEKSKFPLYVKVIYEKERNTCNIGTVKISKLEII